MSNKATSTHEHDHYTEAGENIISSDVQLSNIGRWLKKGWHDMAHAPSISLFYGLAMALSVMLMLFAVQYQPIQMITIAVVFIILSPFLATGLYYTAHRLEQGEKPSLGTSMVAWSSKKSNFGLFAICLVIIAAIWINAVPFFVAVVLGASSLLIVDTSMGVTGFLATQEGLAFLVLFVGHSVIMAAFVFMISVVTIPLMLRDKNIGAISAMILSFKIVMENKLVMTAWALVIGFMLIVGIMSLGLGMLIVMPLLGYASWHAFNDLVSIHENIV
ncbi:DUF2189 domain-containing protein [Thiomicrorhabdus arctica]|uniref:DUF2189 domain-containing protein n=1 Tax=Thiomicrorhabdus arctica TaxID=131540 RepID=UPI00035FC08F|nr:DUF2189 domain-containing protein [Thiomicrorhabdus arctica]